MGLQGHDARRQEGRGPGLRRVHVPRRQDRGEVLVPEVAERVTPQRPPVTGSVWPVMYDASSEARNSTAFATSTGNPRRPSGVIFEGLNSTVRSSSFRPSPVRSVSMGPGATALTLIPYCASSSATSRMKPCTPAFAAEDAAPPAQYAVHGVPSRAPDEMQTILP